MPNMGWDDFDDNGEKYEALSQEQLNRDKIAAVFRNFIKENIYKNPASVTFIESSTFDRRRDVITEELLNQAIDLYSDCYAEECLFGHCVETSREDMLVALGCIESLGIKINEPALKYDLRYHSGVASMHIEGNIPETPETKSSSIDAMINDAINRVNERKNKAADSVLSEDKNICQKERMI